MASSSRIHSNTEQIQWLAPIEEMEYVNKREVYRCFLKLKAHIENCKMAEASEAETVNSFKGRVNVIDGDMSPLSYAIVEEHALAITILLAKGVRAKTSSEDFNDDDEIRCPVTLAVRKKRLDWLQKWSDAPDLNLLENKTLVHFSGPSVGFFRAIRCQALSSAIDTSNYEMLAALLKLVEHSKTPHQALEGIMPLLSVQKDQRALAMVMRSAAKALGNITRNDDNCQPAKKEEVSVYDLINVLGEGFGLAVVQIKDKKLVLELLQDEVLRKHYFPKAVLDLDSVIALESLLGLEGVQILFSSGLHFNDASRMRIKLNLGVLAEAGRADLVEIALSNNCQSLFGDAREGRFRAIKEALSAASDDKCKAMLTDACEKFVLSVLEQPSEPVSKQLLAHIASTGEPALLQRLFGPDCQQLFATSGDREYAIGAGLDNPNSAAADDILLDALIGLCQEPSALKAMDRESMLAKICSGNPERKKGFLTQAAKAMNITDFDSLPLFYRTIRARCWTQLEELLELGANPLMKDSSTTYKTKYGRCGADERTVLHYLVRKGADEDALRALEILAPYIIAREPSDPQLKDQFGRTPVFQLMQDKQALQSPFGRRLQCLEVLIRRDYVLATMLNKLGDTAMSPEQKAASVLLENLNSLENWTRLLVSSDSAASSSDNLLIDTLLEQIGPFYLERLALFQPNLRLPGEKDKQDKEGGGCIIC